MLRSIRYLVPVMALGLVAALSQGLLAQDAPATPGTPNANAATITGTVTGPDGKAVANARVMLQQREEATQEKQAQPEAAKARHKKARAKYKTLQRTTTDQDGKFTFNNVEAGTYRIIASEKDVGMGYTKELTVAAGQNQTADIQLKQRKAREKK